MAGLVGGVFDTLGTAANNLVTGNVRTSSNGLFGIPGTQGWAVPDIGLTEVWGADNNFKNSPETGSANPPGMMSYGYGQMNTGGTPSQSGQQTQVKPPPPVRQVPPKTYIQPSATATPLAQASSDIAAGGQAQGKAQEGLTASQIQELNNNYDWLANQLGISRNTAQTAYNTGTKDIATNAAAAQALYGSAAQKQSDMYSQSQAAALKNFQDSQLMNRNIARAQGALDSSYYGDLQSRNDLGYSANLGNLAQTNQTNMADIDIRRAQAAQQAQSLQAKAYTDLQAQLSEIANNENLGAKQRIAQTNTAMADLQKRIADINQSVSQFQANLGLGREQIQSQLDMARIYANMPKVGGAGGDPTLPKPANPVPSGSYGPRYESALRDQLGYQAAAFNAKNDWRTRLATILGIQ